MMPLPDPYGFCQQRGAVRQTVSLGGGLALATYVVPVCHSWAASQAEMGEWVKAVEGGGRCEGMAGAEMPGLNLPPGKRRSVCNTKKGSRCKLCKRCGSRRMAPAVGWRKGCMPSHSVRHDTALLPRPRHAVLELVHKPLPCPTCGAVSGQASGGTSRGASRKTEVEAPPTPQKRPSNDNGSRKQQAAQPVVPEVGWLWTVGQKPSGGQVSAQMTVADLRQDRISAKKSLGQNFLTDDGILREIVSAAGVRPGDLIIEVGPGTGNLTKHLLATGAHVTAIEKDDVLYARLAETYAQEPNLQLIHGDVLRLDMAALMQGMQIHRPSPAGAPNTSASASSSPSSDAHPPNSPSVSPAQPTLDTALDPPAQEPLAAADEDSHAPSPSSQQHPGASAPSRASTRAGGWRKVKIVANLPYNITTDFLKAVLSKGDTVSELHIMLQEEAGVRLVRSMPGDRDYRAMSLRVALYSKPKYRFCISKTKYYPQPGVDGALITFKLLPPSARLPLPSERGFMTTIEKAFGERRKMLRNSLQPLFSAEQVEDSLGEVGVNKMARAQDLDITQWAALYRTMHARLVKDVVPAAAASDQEPVEQ